MFWGAALDSHPARTTSLRSADGVQETFHSEATAAGFLFVEVAAPKEGLRGRLSQLIDGAVERALDHRGAPPPGDTSPGLAASLVDQLGRAEVTGARGIAVWLAPLAGLTDGYGAFDCDDSRALRWWLSVQATHPIRLGFDAANGALAVYLEPVPVAALLAGHADPAHAAESNPVTPGEPAVVEADSTPEPMTAAGDNPTDDEDPTSLMAESARRMADAMGEDDGSGWLKETLLDLSTPAPVSVQPATPAREGWVPPVAVHTAVREPAVASIDDDDLTEALSSAPAWDDTPAPAPLDLRFVDDEPARATRDLPAAPQAPAMDTETRARLEGWARELEAANGPKPLGVVERLFSTAYSPLRAALDAGADLPRLQHVADEWARSFEKSYTDAFDALRVRAKRPAMVVDVPDVALRVARLHGARSTQLLLVDGMRHDLGERVNDKLRVLVGQRAACAERFLLWAALPTTTANQIELIGRGPSGLRETTGQVSEDMVVARGKKAAMIRRLKSGHREIFKLDVVEARLTEPGGLARHRTDEIADEVAERIALHFEGLQPRTLVMVFGDHGYAVEQTGSCPTLRLGGASPEEVLVPAFAWLVGAVH